MGTRMMWCGGCVASSLDVAIEGCEISSHHRGMFIICINAISSFAWRPSPSSLDRSMNKVERLPTFRNNHRELWRGLDKDRRTSKDTYCDRGVRKLSIL